MAQKKQPRPKGKAMPIPPPMMRGPAPMPMLPSQSQAPPLPPEAMMPPGGHGIPPIFSMPAGPASKKKKGKGK